MTSDLEILSSRVHLPLMRLGMCLDCEACFEIGVTACPACGSKTWMPLARFLETARRDRMVQSVERLQGAEAGDDAGINHHYIIVARDRRALFQHFKEGFADNSTVTVIFDRRGADRRSTTTNVPADRRRGDRRWRAVDEQLRVLGWAVVRVGVKPPTT